jgi:very-short-patch-repair endonuclease
MNKTEEFIEKARLKHGDKYDYSKVVYDGVHNTVIFICDEHGDFKQTPRNHLRSGGCKTCCNSERKSNTEEFIEKAKLKHGENTYGYSKVKYEGNSISVIISCPTHGDFKQRPSDHLHGKGCRKCATIINSNKRRSSNENFIEKAIQKHGINNYGYSKIIYLNNHTDVTITCHLHGDFKQLPLNHLKGRGCYECGHIRTTDSQKGNTIEFIEKAKLKHGENTYDYSKVVYMSSSINIIIGCLIHGDFQQTPNTHIMGGGCYKCGRIESSNKKRFNNDEFIEKSNIIHDNSYDYTKTEYKCATEKVTIICKKHKIPREFSQRATSHLRGRGCPFCKNKTECKLYEKIKPIYPTTDSQFKTEWCINCNSKTNKYLPFDFCIPEHNIIIELDGRQHFIQVMNWQSPEQTFENDKFKEQCANDNNYSVIRLLQEDVLYDKYDWCKELCDAIEEIKQSDDVVNIYLCKNGEYDNF